MIKCKNKKKAKIALLTVLIILVMLLSGCWNNMDLTKLNIISAVGIDKSQDGKIILTVQIVEPGALQSGSSGKGSHGSGKAKPVFVESYEGDTVFDALKSMLSQVDKKVFISSGQVLILGENICKDGINDFINFFERDHEIEYKMDVLISKDTSPKELLEIEDSINPISGIYIKETAENSIFYGKVKRTLLIDLFKDLAGSGKELVIGEITKSAENKVKTQGAGVFKDGRLVGWLDQYATRGYLFAINKVKNTIVDVPIDSDMVSMEVFRSKGKLKVSYKNDEPQKLEVLIDLEANVGDYKGDGRLDSPDKLKKLETALSEEIKKEIMTTLNIAQNEYSSDIFGFGTLVHKYHPQYWKKVKKDWNTIFSQLPSEVKVNVKVRRVGLIKNTIHEE